MACMNTSRLKWIGQVLCLGWGLGLLPGCGPAPKTESIIAFEGFMRAVYTNDMPRVLEGITPESRVKLRKKLDADAGNPKAMASRMVVALGWEFERVSGRMTKIDPKRSDSRKQILIADIGGRTWHIVMKNTAGGWQVDLFESSPVGP